MDISVGTEVGIELNLFLEVKRIIETLIKRVDFTFLQDVPDDDKEIVFEQDYVEGVNVKIPCAAINCDLFEEEGFELGSLAGGNANFWIHIYGSNRIETLSITSFIKKQLHESMHDFFDFSTGDVPDIALPYTSLTMPPVTGQWEVIAEDTIQFITKQNVDKGSREKIESDYLRRYKCTLNGTLRYNR